MIIPEKSIAVLPFVNMSPDPDNEYFSDGITEEIINALTTIKGMKVISRTSSFSFKGKNIDIRTIGNQLGVKTILEGSVRKAKTRVRITAQLINTDDGSHLWAKNFDRELDDIFALQDEISLLIADQIRENFGHFELQEHLIEAPTNNIEAYNQYLQGRYYQLKWNDEDMQKGIDCYKNSIALDPQFALPYFGAALSYGIIAAWRFIPYGEGIQQADHYLKEGLKINPHSFFGYFAQAIINFWGKWEFKKGHQAAQKAMALNPSFTEAEAILGEIYTVTGNFDLGIKHMNNTLTLNPLSPNHHYTLGNIDYLQQRYHQAIQRQEAALKIDPHFAISIEIIAACYILLQDYSKLDEFLINHPTAEQPDKCRALYKLMYPEEPISIDLDTFRMNIQSNTSSSLIPWYLYIHIYLDHQELALDILENGMKQCAGQFINFRHDPFLAPLHQTERFQNLIHQVFPSSKLPNTKEEEPFVTNPNSHLDNEELNQHLRTITQLLEEESLFLEPSLSLKSLAEQANIHPNKLSWLLNECIGKNFNEYINSYRLEAFKQKALDPTNSHLTILGLAYESGFNSKTVFNTFFKKMEGTTPKAWVKSNMD